MDYQKLKNQPIKLVMAEIRFSPVLKIKHYIPELQDGLRDQYPLLESGHDRAVNITDQQFQVNEIERWIFISKDRRSLVDVSEDRLLFVTSVYERFGPFSNSFQNIVQVISDILKPGLFSRLGLRYLDAIVPTKNESISELIDTGFLMPQSLSRLADTNLGHKSESGLQIKDGHLIVRALHVQSDLIVMPDQAQVPIIIPASEEEKKSSVRVLLDIDHYWQDNQKQEDFDVRAILGRLEKLHEPSREAFFTITTDYARNEKWS